MALTLRLTPQEIKALEEIKKILGKSNMPSTTAISMLISTYKRREDENESLRNEVETLNKIVREQESIILSCSDAVNKIIQFKKYTKT